MRPLARLAVVAVVVLPLSAHAADAQRPDALADALARALVERRAELRPQTHATDFGNDAIGCITVTRRDLRRFGYSGHAFLCEEGASAQVLGAVLDAAGRRRCFISGFYAGELCYDFDICGFHDTACVD
jgi:hypothetical protein